MKEPPVEEHATFSHRFLKNCTYLENRDLLQAYILSLTTSSWCRFAELFPSDEEA